VYPPGALELERPLLAEGAWGAPDRAGRTIAAEPERLPMRTGLFGLPPLERRALRYAKSADGLPLLGPLPGVQGLAVACGHGELGVALAPAAGSAIAAGIATGTWDEALLPERLL
jgi:glycine/D-amino acid oxidase-like deaminating enzyme